jgi:ribosome modulation factor
MAHLTLVTLLFLIPSLKGMQWARRGRKLGIRGALLLAATVATLTALATWMGGWRQKALEKWSEGKWNPGGPSWQERLVPLLVVSWPAMYLLATLSVQHLRGKNKPLNI